MLETNENYNEPAMARKATPLENVLAMQEKLVAEMSEHLHFLKQKLKPLSRESPTDESEPEDPADVQKSPVVAQLDYLNGRLRRFVREVQDMAANLEV